MVKIVCQLVSFRWLRVSLRANVTQVSTPNTARGTYAKTAGKRREILDAAFAVFSEKGYESGSVREIAERAGMTHTAVLFHFKTKVELLAAVLEVRDEISRERFAAPSDSPLAQVLAYIDLLRDNLTDPGMIEMYSVLSAEATSSAHPAHEYFERRYDWIIAQAREALTEMQEAGTLRDGISADYAARTLIALADGLQLQFLYNRTGVDMVDTLRTFVQSIITVTLDDA